MQLERVADLGIEIELLRYSAAHHNSSSRAQLGQYFTPWPIASFMASMLVCNKDIIRVLDPGAGVGSLAVAVVKALCERESRPTLIELTLVEIDAGLRSYLEKSVQLCEVYCNAVGIRIRTEIVTQDFLECASEWGGSILFGEQRRFDVVIMNPPYKKIASTSKERRLLRSIGVETTNIYTGFLAASINLLEDFGELVAITPRSFCNGTYFTSFRKFLLRSTRLTRLHTYESRNQAFHADDVLQENIIFRCEKSAIQAQEIQISQSTGSEVISDIPNIKSYEVPYDQVVRPTDRQAFIRVIPNARELNIALEIAQFSASLGSLGVKVSTGRVVDFRASEHLRLQPAENTVPLIYPAHFHDGSIEWPKAGIKKPNAIVLNEFTREQLVHNSTYVLVKRFSSKEEKKRVVAVLYEPTVHEGPLVAFENHLNYFHSNGLGLPKELALGLMIYLNSSLIDSYFRQFNGHTQVNASDLRSIPYPAKLSLERMGKVAAPLGALSQEVIDRLVGDVLE